MYGLDSIRRFQEGGVTDALVRQYLDSRPGISESQIAQVMRETGVSPEQVARCNWSGSRLRFTKIQPVSRPG
jgi:hypothetical protein